MHLPNLLASRFLAALQPWVTTPEKYAGMVRGTSDPAQGDYQFNAAMAIAKTLKRPSIEVAQEIVSKLDVADICDHVSAAGPGFINLRIRDEFLRDQLYELATQPRFGIDRLETAETVVIDFSSPNVAKPMHVGHIRSTVIGDALAKVYAYRGFNVITDNHLGDWGTQFGIIIYGFKHFGDDAALADDPIGHLSTLYRRIQALIELQKTRHNLPEWKQQAQQARLAVESAQSALAGVDPNAKKDRKKAEKSLSAAERKLASIEKQILGGEQKMAAVDADPALRDELSRHDNLQQSVLEETAKLHRGDPENKSMWERFLPSCLDEIDRIYRRLDVTFDHTLGESFYHPMLADVVENLKRRDLAQTSEGAICVFLDGYDAPMIIQKRDGAYLYATTDLATLDYRKQHFDPTTILYVVDTRQSEHFEKLFAAAKAIGLDAMKLVHVNFGTVLGKDGKPMKTRSGTLIGLEGLLDDAVQRATAVVCDPDRLQQFDPPMLPAEQQDVAEVVGIGAIKFADLSHHRSSDYRFDVEKMVALDGNTATYVQYQYARTQSIFRKMRMDEDAVDAIIAKRQWTMTQPAERALVLQMLKFAEAIETTIADNAPNGMTDFVIELARGYARFNDSCSVRDAETDEIRDIRIALVAVSGRMMKESLAMLGIGVVDRM